MIVDCAGMVFSSVRNRRSARTASGPRKNEVKGNGIYLSKPDGEIRSVVGASLLANSGIREQARSHQAEQGSAAGQFFA
jgi:hypothetical protein